MLLWVDLFNSFDGTLDHSVNRPGSERMLGMVKHEDYKPQQGTWKLVAPDGREWEAESPIACVSKEQAERIPATVRLQRLMGHFEDAPPCTEDSDMGDIEEVMVTTGTLIHINGLPFRIKDDIVVLGKQENYDLAANSEA
jgi:hypothetical protein